MFADSDILIWYLRGRQSARQILADCAPIQVSSISYMELVQGVRNRDELNDLRKTFRARKWIIRPVCESISSRAIGIIERYSLSQGIRLADALIAATCIELGEALIAANVRHYSFLSELSVRPYVTN